MAAWSGLRTLFSTLRILCAQHLCTGSPGKAVGRAARRPEPPSTHSISRRWPVEATPDQIAEKELPFGGALGGRETEVDDLLAAVGAQAQGHQHRPGQRAGAGLALEHDAIQDQHPIVVLQRPLVEGGHGGIELLGHPADRARADRLPKDRQQRPGHLARRQAEHEAGEDQAIDMVGTAGVGAHHLEGAEIPGARPESSIWPSSVSSQRR